MEFFFKANLLWIAVAVVMVQGGDCLDCFNCQDISENEDCHNVKRCTNNQSCFAERTLKDNRTKFNMGCIDSQRCKNRQDFKIFGRSISDHCLDCCLTDGCNRELCEEERVSDVPVYKSCIDDPEADCAHLASVTHICSHIHHAKRICRKHCGLCSLVDGDWSQWSDWTPCSTSCGVGTHYRTRTCTNPAPQHRGDDCKGNDTQIHSCFTRECPVHGEWSPWGTWEACSVTCGQGVTKRHRTCTNPTPSLYGHYCFGDPVDFNLCNEQECGDVKDHDNFTPVYTCQDVLSECEVANSTTGICNLQWYARKMCPEFCGLCSILDGSWADWTSWSACSTSCGKGTWSRSRSCTSPAPANGGSFCSGSTTDTGVCNLRDCPVHGGWSVWAHWTTCSSTCSRGITKRVRTCTNPRPTLTGNACFGDSTEYELCTIKECPVVGQWTDWLQWSGCSVTCGTGSKTRTRLCLNPKPSNGGQYCAGPSSDQAMCKADTCPVNGGWSRWTSWSSCSQTCNGGQKTRRRVCTNPTPVGLGRRCEGNSDDVSICTTSVCPGLPLNILARHAFTILRTGNLTYEGYDFLLLEVRVPNSGVSRSSNWCSDYQLLCDDFLRRPTGCGEYYYKKSGYSSCREQYNSDMNIGDTLGCNPSGKVAELARKAFPDRSSQIDAAVSFGFHACDESRCQRTIKQSGLALQQVAGFGSSRTTLYTICH